MWLICTQGEDKGICREIGKDTYTMGRASDCDMLLADTHSSRYHCRLQLKGDRLVVEDLNSTNGIKFEGKRHRGKTVKVRPEGSFSIGSDVFLFTATFKDAQSAEAAAKAPAKGGFNAVDTAVMTRTKADVFPTGGATGVPKREGGLWDFIKNLGKK